jgi:hypothetical protein
MNSRPLAGLPLLSILAIGLAGVANAQLSERSIPYSGFLEEDGQPFDGLADVEFEITDEAGIEILLAELHEDVPFTQGRFSVLIGSVDPDGLPVELFIYPELRLQVRVNGTDIGAPQPLPKTIRAIGQAPYLSAYSGLVFGNVMSEGVRIESGGRDLMIQGDHPDNTGTLWLGNYDAPRGTPEAPIYNIAARNNMTVGGRLNVASDLQVSGNLTVNGQIIDGSGGGGGPAFGYDISCVGAEVFKNEVLSERYTRRPFACCRLNRDNGEVQCKERYEAFQAASDYQGEWRAFSGQSINGLQNTFAWQAEGSPVAPYSLNCSADHRIEVLDNTLSPRIRCCRIDRTGDTECITTSGVLGGNPIFQRDWKQVSNASNESNPW